MTKRRWNRSIRRLTAAAAGLLLAAHAHAASPVVSFVATPGAPTTGSLLTLDILVTGATDLYGWQLTLGFDPAKLQAQSVTEGAFLRPAGSTFFSGAIDNAAGSIPSFDTLIGNIAGRSGGGVLERIVFSVKGAGSSPITFGDLLFLDSSLSDLGATAVGGSVLIGGVAAPVPEPSTAGLLAFGLVAFGLARRTFRTI